MFHGTLKETYPIIRLTFELVNVKRIVEIFNVNLLARGLVDIFITSFYFFIIGFKFLQTFHLFLIIHSVHVLFEAPFVQNQLFNGILLQIRINNFKKK